jgi:hypothetical protein
VFESSDPYIGRKRYCLHTGNRLIRLLALKISCWLLVEPTPVDKFNGVRLFDLHAGVHVDREKFAPRIGGTRSAVAVSLIEEFKKPLISFINWMGASLRVVTQG